MIFKLQHQWFLYKCYRWNVKYFFDIRSQCDPFLSVGRDKRRIDPFIASKKHQLRRNTRAAAAGRKISSRVRRSQKVRRRRADALTWRAALIGRLRLVAPAALRA
jgi:hypothetical protein